jgi:proteasome assembly chaperone (PAC2) family protein
MNTEYPNTITKISKEVKMKDGILIQCFPGQGLVGRIAGMQLIDYFKAKEVAKIYSSYFPHMVIFHGELGKLIHAELWAIEDTNPPLLILTGESQPQEGPDGMFTVLNAVLDLVEKWGIKTVMAIGGFRSTSKKTPDVTAFAYTDQDAQTLKDHKIKLFTEGRVSGAVGVLTALAAERGLTSYGLMGKVKLQNKSKIAFEVDPIAAKNVLKVVADLANIELDLSKMDKMITEIEQTEANAMKVLKEIESSGEEKSDQKSYYI